MHSGLILYLLLLNLHQVHLILLRTDNLQLLILPALDVMHDLLYLEPFLVN